MSSFSKTLFAILIFFGTALISDNMAVAQSAETDSVHTVRPGETLFSISRIYDVTVGDLRNWNQLQTDSLSPGAELRVKPPASQGQIRHTVRPGESLFGISREYNVTIAEIQQWNNLTGTSLESGRELIIYRDEEAPGQETLPPAETTTEVEPSERQSLVRIAERPSESTTYLVRSGDSLFRIAREHDMTVDELRQLNNLQGDDLRVGQRLSVREVRTAPSIAEGAENSTPQGKFVLYRVESGENLNSLLRKFQMSERELSSLNPDINVENISSGQRLTVLLPPTRNFQNPFRQGAGLEDLGEVSVTRYSENERANPTTSGELYNPDELTAAHSNMALGNVVYVENPSNGKGIYVRVNDRYSGDGLKLSHKAFDMLSFSSVERAKVTIYLDN